MSIAYLAGEELKYSAYNQNKLAVIPAAGGQPRLLAQTLDRPIRQPVWSKDGASLTVVVVDDRSQYPARVALGTGRVERLVTAKSVVNTLSAGSGDGDFAVLTSTDTEPAEVAALEGDAGSGAARLRRISHQNDAWLANVLLGTTEDFTSTSKDGTE